MKKLLILFFIIIVNVTKSYATEDYTYVCANHILVPTEMDAIKLRSQINSYDDFTYYAKIYSKCPSAKNGGNLGCFERGQMVKPFETAAFEGQVGEVSNPIKTRFGYHLIWVTKKF